MNSDQFEKGEVRIFEFQVTSKVAAPVVIASATWELRTRSVVVERGNCDVNKSMISMVVPMMTAGDFTLEVTAEIPPETIIERLHVRVVE